MDTQTPIATARSALEAMCRLVERADAQFTFSDMLELRSLSRKISFASPALGADELLAQIEQHARALHEMDSTDNSAGRILRRRLGKLLGQLNYCLVRAAESRQAA